MSSTNECLNTSSSSTLNHNEVDHAIPLNTNTPVSGNLRSYHLRDRSITAEKNERMLKRQSRCYSPESKNRQNTNVKLRGMIRKRKLVFTEASPQTVPDHKLRNIGKRCNATIIKPKKNRLTKKTDADDDFCAGENSPLVSLNSVGIENEDVSLPIAIEEVNREYSITHWKEQIEHDVLINFGVHAIPIAKSILNNEATIDAISQYRQWNPFSEDGMIPLSSISPVLCSKFAYLHTIPLQRELTSQQMVVMLRDRNVFSFIRANIDANPGLKNSRQDQMQLCSQYIELRNSAQEYVIGKMMLHFSG